MNLGCSTGGLAYPPEIPIAKTFPKKAPPVAGPRGKPRSSGQCGCGLLQSLEGLAGLLGLQQREVRIEIERFLEELARLVLVAEASVDQAGVIEQRGVLRPQFQRLDHRLGRFLVTLGL